MDAAMGAPIAKTSKPILPSGIRILRIVLVPKVFVPKVDKPVAAPRHTDRLAFPACFLRINRVDIVDCPRMIRLNHTRGRGTQLDTSVRQTDRSTVQVSDGSNENAGDFAARGQCPDSASGPRATSSVPDEATRRFPMPPLAGRPDDPGPCH
jgi:hypothetical protein